MISSNQTSNQTLNQQGQALSEYLILLILVSLASITLVQGLGGAIKQKIKEARHAIEKGVSLKNPGDVSDDPNPILGRF